MGFFGKVSHQLRGGAVGERLSDEAQRAILGSLELGRPREPMRLWRVLLWPAVALFLYQVEAGLLAHLGPEAVRVEVAVVVVVFAALQLGAIEGALAAFALGWVADLFVQGPPGLCRFLAVAAWTVVRIASARIGQPGPLASFAYTAAAAAAYQAGVLGGISLVAEPGSGPGTIAWLSVVPQALLTAGFAIPLHRLLARLDRATAGGEPAR